MEGRLNFKTMLIVVGLFVFASIVLFAPAKEATFWNAIALGGLMVFFWIFELLPIYVTALFPLVLAVPLHVLEPDQLAGAYGHRMVYLFFGGFVLSLALEKWDVHKQIAQGIIRIVGTSKARILLGFLLATGILSMWISNTATALMMLPMAMAVIHGLPMQKNSKFPLYLLLAIAYGASLGGMATLVGTPPNGAMLSVLESNYNISIDFFDWMAVGLPLSLIMMMVVYLFFLLLLGKESRTEIEGFKLEKKPWTKEQIRVMVLFLVIVVLWSFRGPITKYTGITYKDEGPAILGAMLLFLIPAAKKTTKSTLLVWKDMRDLPWGILILFGGGLALAKMLEVNGVITELSHVFDKFDGMHIFVILLVLVGIAIYGTEVMSNLALVNVFVPVVAVFAINTNYDVLQLCIPVTLAASCAFMLPISTPPNAIIFSSGQITVSQMAKVGFVLNLIGVLIVSLFSLIFIS
jgi:sodium-dependent dicarboxylate transporter 2/3/5